MPPIPPADTAALTYRVAFLERVGFFAVLLELKTRTPRLREICRFNWLRGDLFEVVSRKLVSELARPFFAKVAKFEVDESI